MFALRLQSHEVNYIDHPDFKIGQMFPHDGNRSESFQRWHVATAGHDHVGSSVLVVTGPLPDTDAFRAMRDGSFHCQPLWRWMFARDDDVDIMAAAQAMVHD